MGIGEASEAALGRGRAVWPSFLRGADAAEVLARLSQGDPLRLHERAALRLREVWILLDPERVAYRALGVCADAAPCEEPPEDLSAWALAKIDLAIEQLVCADREAEKAGPAPYTEGVKEFPLLTECLMMEPELARAASVAFNALEPLPRRAFFELMVEGREVADCIESGPWDEDGLYHAIHAALVALGLDDSAGPADPRKKGKRT